VVFWPYRLAAPMPTLEWSKKEEIKNGILASFKIKKNRNTNLGFLFGFTSFVHNTHIKRTGRISLIQAIVFQKNHSILLL
jgi:hypothetical protein